MTSHWGCGSGTFRCSFSVNSHASSFPFLGMNFIETMFLICYSRWTWSTLQTPLCIQCPASPPLPMVRYPDWSCVLHWRQSSWLISHTGKFIACQSLDNRITIYMVGDRFKEMRKKVLKESNERIHFWTIALMCKSNFINMLLLRFSRGTWWLGMHVAWTSVLKWATSAGLWISHSLVIQKYD